MLNFPNLIGLRQIILNTWKDGQRYVIICSGQKSGKTSLINSLLEECKHLYITSGTIELSRTVMNQAKLANINSYLANYVFDFQKNNIIVINEAFFFSSHQHFLRFIKNNVNNRILIIGSYGWGIQEYQSNGYEILYFNSWDLNPNLIKNSLRNTYKDMSENTFLCDYGCRDLYEKNIK